MISSFNCHTDAGLMLSVGINGHTIVLATDEQSFFPVASIYLPAEYTEAVQRGVEAFNRAFSEAMSAGDNARTWTEAAE